MTPPRAIVIGFCAGAAFCVMLGLSSLLWVPSGGTLPSGVVAPLAFVLLAPVFDRAALALGGDAGPRVFWSSVCWLIPLLVVGMAHELLVAFYESPLFAFGYVGLDSFNRLSVPAVVLTTTTAALITTVARQLGVRSTLLRRFSPWLAMGATLLCTVVITVKGSGRPTPEQWMGSFKGIGTVPAVAMPDDTLSQPTLNYAYRSPDIERLHVARYCDQGNCLTLLSEKPLPDKLDPNQDARGSWRAYGPPDILFVARNPKLHLLRLEGPGFRQVVEESSFADLGGPSAYASGMTPPLAIMLVGFLAVGMAFWALYRRPGALAVVRGLAGDWRPARMTADGVVLVDDLPPMHAPKGITHLAGPVLVLLDTPHAATFRSTGAPAVMRLLQGMDADLAGRRGILDEGARAYATAAALLPAAAIFTAIYLGMS